MSSKLSTLLQHRTSNVQHVTKTQKPVRQVTPAIATQHYSNLCNFFTPSVYLQNNEHEVNFDYTLAVYSLVCYNRQYYNLEDVPLYQSNRSTK